MKRACLLAILLIILIIFLITNISAIRINEVELNPSGQDTGNEWIEFYSDEEIDLEIYKLVNNDGNEIILSGVFSGYYVYVFEKQWLDNSDEEVFLYKDEELIDETDLFDDDKNDGMSWQFCELWKFVEATRGEENSCESNSDENIQNNKTSFNKEIKNETLIEENQNLDNETKSSVQQNESKEKRKSELIRLTAKDIKSPENEEIEGESALEKNKYPVYGLVIFSVLIAVLFLLRRKKYKNEFE